MREKLVREKSEELETERAKARQKIAEVNDLADKRVQEVRQKLTNEFAMERSQWEEKLTKLRNEKERAITKAVETYRAERELEVFSIPLFR